MTSIQSSGNNEGAGEDVISPVSASAAYYRITVRVTGPRNSVSYVQALVLM